MADEYETPEAIIPELADAYKIVEAMQALQTHFGWQMLMKIIQEQIDARFSEIITQRNSFDELIAQEYIKGQCHSLILVKNYPTALIEASRHTIKQLLPEVEETENVSGD